MNNLAYLSVVVLFAIISSCTNPNSEQRNAVFITSADTIDFGTIVYPDSIEKEITISNIGNDTLKLSKFIASCGCTIPKISDTAILSNSSTKLRVMFKPNENDSGKFSKSIVIRTNCEDPFKIIRLIGKVEKN